MTDDQATVSIKARIESESAGIMEMKRPLKLLDLPLDVLKTILKVVRCLLIVLKEDEIDQPLQIPHANDLAALALTNSTLHGLVIPSMYSRFDIIWPNSAISTEPRTGVDALTYGLATLVMREDLFEHAMLERSSPNHDACQSFECKDCGHVNYVNNAKSSRKGRLRRGNFFSQFVKSFSLGNGPPDMVQEYVVTKEGGKMLGTLVALSIARMPNLEAFIWDMPTGILRDVWSSLSSLGDHHPPKLQKVSIRFHNNRKAMEETDLVRSSSTTQPIITATAIPQTSVQPVTTNALQAKFIVSNHYVESPNFSILPPLRSLTAIAIDELANLDELSLLIGKSIDCLRELRVGMALELHTSGLPSNSRAMKYLCKGGSHGTLLLLFSGLSHCRPKGDVVEVQAEGKSLLYEPFIEQDDGLVSSGPSQVIALSDFLAGRSSTSSAASELVTKPISGIQADSEVDITRIDPALACSESVKLDNGLSAEPCQLSAEVLEEGAAIERKSKPKLNAAPQVTNDERSKLPAKTSHQFTSSPAPQKLRLEILELERHTINVKLLSEAIDWSILTSLTLLSCPDTDAIWQAFRTWYAPVLRPTSIRLSMPAKLFDDKRPIEPRLRRMPSSPRPAEQETVYRLNIKRLHTNTVSTKLLAFLKETLAPNSLESLFLQDCPGYQSGVTITQIYRGPVKRHKGSLSQLLISSAHDVTSSRTRAVSARKWMLNREVLDYITTPKKMPKLRELSIALEYKDWHFFIQQLPNLQGLRSLHIPFIADHVYGPKYNMRDVAMGVVDVINLRKECELTYLGICDKCFEIAEVAVKPLRKRGATGTAELASGVDDESSGDDLTPHVSDSDDDDDDDSDEDGGVAAAPGPTPAPTSDDDLGEDDVSSEEEQGAHSGEQVKMKLREILFYDDKIAIFKARNGKL